MFSSIGGGATLKNIKLDNCNVSGINNVGGLSGFSYGATVTNCGITGLVQGEDTISGLIGLAVAIPFTYLIALPKSMYPGGNLGGIVGQLSAQNSLIDNCSVTGSIGRNRGLHWRNNRSHYSGCLIRNCTHQRLLSSVTVGLLAAYQVRPMGKYPTDVMSPVPSGAKAPRVLVD